VEQVVPEALAEQAVPVVMVVEPVALVEQAALNCP
jgi:hypothetical protein